MKATEASVAHAVEDLGHGNVLYCRRQLDDRKLTIRFVKGESTRSCGANEISSSRVRAVMQTQRANSSREALELLALSTQVLWSYRSSWLEKARLGANDCIKFQPVYENDVDSLYDKGNELADEFKEDRDVMRKKRCLLATRQGASSCIKLLPTCEDDLALEKKKPQPDQTQRSRRNSC